MRHQVVEFTAMGCPCSVEAFAKSEAQLHECLALARAEIERIEESIPDIVMVVGCLS